MSGNSGNFTSFATLGSLFLIVLMMYWGAPVLMPLAMALLLAFVLNPVVSLLRRWHIRHTLAVTVVVTLAFSLLGAVLLIIGQQFNSLVTELPRYEDNIRQKVRDLRAIVRNRSFNRVQETFEKIKGELEAPDAGSTNAAAVTNVTTTNVATTNVATTNARPPQPAPKEAAPPTKSGLFTQLLGPLSTILATAGLVIVLVIFLLLRRDDQLNRLIRLGGRAERAMTRKILSEAEERISRYLLTYTILNAIYGVCAAIGLAIIGLPYAVMWGFFAGIVRFIPYVGPWLGALLPITLSLAVFPGWLHPLLIAAFYATIELVTNMVLEPIFYGRSAGVSEVGLIVALAFWTLVWGPVGLLLGTPLTVCLVVLAKHVPTLEPLHILIGEETNDNDDAKEAEAK
ncbi:MAG TPA: AI-2E family transporter [Verrucomicrobiae bacterium]|nr:AI-2E family transporter [Verrucomicrobiae bacterium]